MIETQQLCKRYGRFTAVDGIGFRVEPGQVLGFLGPNGAGKSTTMKMLAGFLAPTSGTAKVCGFDVQAEPLKAKAALGYLPEGAPSYGEMTPLQFLDFVADVRGLAGEHGGAEQRLEHLARQPAGAGSGLQDTEDHDLLHMAGLMRSGSSQARAASSSSWHGCRWA